MQSTGHEKQEDVTLTDAVEESAEQLPLRLLVSVTVVKTVPRRVGGRKREERSGKGLRPAARVLCASLKQDGLLVGGGHKCHVR